VVRGFSRIKVARLVVSVGGGIRKDREGGGISFESGAPRGGGACRGEKKKESRQRKR